MATKDLRGDRVVLRAVTEADLAPLHELLNEPDVAPWWPRMDPPAVRSDLLEHEPSEKEVYVIDVEGEVVGVIQSYEETDPDYRHAGMDIAVATRWHGRGVALDALRTLARHLVHDLGHHRLVIDPAVENERAIACYRKLGYRAVGVMRRNERGPDGTFRDSLLMDLLADELR